MDMTLSKRGDYVLRSAISLARAFEVGVPRKIREVVDETEVPRTFASQILADLVRAGVASSRAGRNGGYWLARAPEDISVLEVVEAAEGPLHAERCALGEGPCRWEAVCPLHETWSAATAVLRQVLATTTLAEVAARDHSIETGTYPIPADSHRMDPAAVAVADVVHVELEEAVARIRLSRSAHMLGPIVDAACSEATLSERRTAGETNPTRHLAMRTGPTGPAARSHFFPQLPRLRASSAATCSVGSSRPKVAASSSMPRWRSPPSTPSAASCGSKALGGRSLHCRPSGWRPASSTNWPVARCAPSCAGWLRRSSRRRRSPPTPDGALAGRRADLWPMR